MKPVRFAFLAVVAVLVAGAAGAVAHHPAPAHHAAVDWTSVVVPTADGGVRVGNPQSKVKLVEYFSTTCPHCAAFSKEAYPAILDKYVRGGQVSFEVRLALRDAIDLVAAKSARCAAPTRYFATLEDVMGTQSDWEPRAIDWVNAHTSDLNGPNKDAAIRALVAGAGIGAVVAKHGVTPAALGACLQSKPIDQALERSTNDAWNVRKIDGTPSFLINDAVQKDVYGWAGLEPLIQAALKA
jgi:protein-disulfide isomerase